MKRILPILLSAAIVFGLCACSPAETAPAEISPAASGPGQPSQATPVPAPDSGALTITFGHGGNPYTMILEENDTAVKIAEYVGTADWNLPIYHYDDYDNWEVMQYYDIPSRYDIPSNAETITEEKAGDVYYSEPNRIILFYRDGEVEGDYTKVGTIEATEDFMQAVENNPVLEGWGNKIVTVSPAD